MKVNSNPSNGNINYFNKSLNICPVCNSSKQNEINETSAETVEVSPYKSIYYTKNIFDCKVCGCQWESDLNDIYRV